MKYLKYLGLLAEILDVIESLKTPGETAELRPSYRGRKIKITVSRME